MTFLISCLIVLPIGGIIWYKINQAYENEAKQKQMAEERRLQAVQARKEMQAKIIQFAKENGVDLSKLYQKRDESYNNMMKYAGFSALTRPTTPTYSRGVVEGSLADNIATLANAQKKADYENAMAENMGYARSSSLYRSDYIVTAERIITMLKSIPNSQQYVAYEEQEYKARREKMQNLGMSC